MESCSVRYCLGHGFTMDGKHDAISGQKSSDDPNVIYRSTFSVVTGFNFVKLICTSWLLYARFWLGEG